MNHPSPDHAEINQLALRLQTSAPNHDPGVARPLMLLAPVLRHTCRCRPVPGHEHDDLMQLASLAVLDAVKTYRADRGDFVPLVREVVLRQLTAAYHAQCAQKRRTLNRAVSLDAPVGAGEAQTTLGVPQPPQLFPGTVEQSERAQRARQNPTSLG